MNDNKILAFVGTNSVRGSKGIYSVSINAESGEMRIVSTHQVYNTGAIAISKDRNLLYAGSEGMSFKGIADGGVYGYRFDCEGILTEIGSARSFGQRTCSVALDNKNENVYGANFYQGTWVKWELDNNYAPKFPKLIIEGREKPDTFLKALHCILPIGERYVGVISLTEGALIIYNAEDGTRVTEYVFPGHPFCRVLETCGNCIYAMMQDPGDIYVFRNELDTKGSITPIQVISVQKQKLEHYGTTALKATPNGKLMIAATRDNNTLTVFRVAKDGTLLLSDVVKLPGETPRDFGISGDGTFVVTCLQKSDRICVHRIDEERGTLVDTGYSLEIPSPASIALTGRFC